MEQENSILIENGQEIIANAPPYPETKPESPVEDRTEIGYLIASAGSGGRSYPLEGAQIEVYLQENGVWTLFRRTATDATGAAPKLSIPTPKAPADIDENNPFAPYTVARVRAFRDGYYPIEAKEVPVFSGITSLQYFEFIPLSESDTLAPPTGTLVTVGENASSSIDAITPNGTNVSDTTVIPPNDLE